MECDFSFIERKLHCPDLFGAGLCNTCFVAILYLIYDLILYHFKLLVFILKAFWGLTFRSRSTSFSEKPFFLSAGIR